MTDVVTLEEHHKQSLWARYTTMGLGVWLLVGLATFGVSKASLGWSDGVSGFLLIIFSFLSLSARRIWAPWIVCVIGIWLQLAPIFFWAPTAYDYVNNTLVGLACMAFSVLIPGTPGVVTETGPEVPLGWSYNPSSWAQRLPVIALGIVCWLTARFMAAYQLGYIDTMWDPIFGDGTLNVITSKLSKSFPVSDAGLGAAAYSIEALMGCKGGTRRWHSMPWIVLLFGILVVPVGLVSILLIMMQPLVVGAWCGWCLLTALCMLVMIMLTLDEVMAMFQFLGESRRNGNSLWSLFWKGSSSIVVRNDDRAPAVNAAPRKLFPGMVWGVTIPWNLLLSAILGIWMLFSPDLLNPMKNLVSDVNHVVGALIAAISIIAMAEVTRIIRYINILFGVILIAAPWILMDANPDANLAEMVNNIIIGIVLIALAFRRGPVHEKYGSLQRYIR